MDAQQSCPSSPGGCPHSRSSTTSSANYSSDDSGKPVRHHAIKHRHAPAAAPGSHREFLQQQKQRQLIQEETLNTAGTFNCVYDSTDADLAMEDYITNSIVEGLPGHYHADGSAHIKRTPTRAARAMARTGSRRAARTNDEHKQQQQQAYATTGISGFSRRSAQSHQIRRKPVPVAPPAPVSPLSVSSQKEVCPARHAVKTRFTEHF